LKGWGSGRFASDESGEIVGFTDLDEWGYIVTKTMPTVGGKVADVLNNFTNHEFDRVLGVYYAKAQFYDPELKCIADFEELQWGRYYAFPVFTVCGILRFVAYKLP